MCANAQRTLTAIHEWLQTKTFENEEEHTGQTLSCRLSPSTND